MGKQYVCIDLKSFYASVECVERGLDPMTTNLVVADPERTDKTICLAITPAMKALGISNRCRVFQIPKGVEYIMAEPRMALYIDYAAEIYGVYLKYIAKEDIHVYSIDEAFMDAELLIDHSWGRETTTIADIKAYTPQNRSITSGQVLMRDYSFEEGKLIIKEMADLLCLDLVEQNFITDSITMQVGYGNSFGEPPVRGTAALPFKTNADKMIIPALVELYEQIVDSRYAIRRVNLSCNRLVREEYRQYNFLADMEELEKDRKAQKAMLAIKKRYGKNAVLRGMNLEESATTRERNRQIGGHKSGR